MNSQPNLASIRNTFGIIGHKDILGSHLQERSLSLQDYKNGYIHEDRDRNKPYILLLDHRTTDALYTHKNINVIVSFQRRTNGNFAIARINVMKNIEIEQND